jgi:hypothetical protein
VLLVDESVTRSYCLFGSDRFYEGAPVPAIASGNRGNR